MGDLDLVRVESAVSATASGNLTDGKWSHDVATALGFAGRHNPLGFAVVRFLSDTPSSVEVWNLVLVLATQLMRQKHLDQATAREAAWQGYEFWNNSRCMTCGGRGVLDQAQRKCPTCNGTGKRKEPKSPVEVRDAIGLLIEAEVWMEKQLAARLKGNRVSNDEKYHCTLPMKDSQFDHGFSHNPRTPIHHANDK